MPKKLIEIKIKDGFGKKFPAKHLKDGSEFQIASSTALSLLRKGYVVATENNDVDYNKIVADEKKEAAAVESLAKKNREKAKKDAIKLTEKNLDDKLAKQKEAKFAAKKASDETLKEKKAAKKK